MTDEIRHGCTVYDYRTPEPTPQPTTVWTITQLDAAGLMAFARALVAADSDKASRLIDALITVLEVEPDAERHERIAPRLQDAIAARDYVDTAALD